MDTLNNIEHIELYIKKFPDFSNLYQLWKQFFSLHVAGNEHHILPLLHVLIASQFLNSKFIDGAKTRNLRTHYFMIQPSGTGKGEAMKTAVEVINEMDERMYPGENKRTAQYLGNEVNPHTLRGGIEERRERVLVEEQETTGQQTSGQRTKKRTQGRQKQKYKYEQIRRMIPGALQTMSLLAWGEGKDLIAPESQQSAGFRSMILNVTDDPPIVTFPARKDMSNKGEILQYYANSNLVTGTTEIQDINLETLERGFFSRFLFSYKTFQQKEADDLEKKVMEMAAKNVYNESKILKESVCDAIQYIKRDIEEKPLTFDENTIKQYIEHKFTQKEKVMPAGEYFGKKREIMESAFMRSTLYDKKLACHVALIEGVHNPSIDMLKYASEITFNSLCSFSQLLNKFFSPSMNQSEKGRMQTVLNIIKHHKTNIMHNELLYQLERERKTGIWDLGESHTEDFIKTLVREKVIVKGEKNGVVSYICG